MKSTIELPGEFIPDDVSNVVIDNVLKALDGINTMGGQFIVNDSPFFRHQRSNKVTPCVMNSANYISSNFQYNLSNIEGCEGETKLLGQAFDGFIKVSYSGVGYKIIDPDRLLAIIHEYIRINGLPRQTVYTLFPMFYGMYVERGYYDVGPLIFAKEHFIPTSVDVSYKVGVEFETGNVASSFRAINKLYTLFQEGAIDCGCFITSIDKSSCATRIWPVSNRNGSFQELEQRNYKNQISLPLIAVGFAPDGFDKKAPFLGRKGGLYTPFDTGNVDASGKFKVFFGEDGEEVLYPNY